MTGIRNIPYRWSNRYDLRYGLNFLGLYWTKNILLDTMKLFVFELVAQWVQLWTSNSISQRLIYHFMVSLLKRRTKKRPFAFHARYLKNFLSFIFWFILDQRCHDVKIFEFELVAQRVRLYTNNIMYIFLFYKLQNVDLIIPLNMTIYLQQI